MEWNTFKHTKKKGVGLNHSLWCKAQKIKRFYQEEDTIPKLDVGQTLPGCF